MHDTVKEGDLLTIAAPAGRFTFTGADATGVALLAAGVGITPLMSIVRYLTDQNWGGQIYFVYSYKTERDIIFREELEALRRRFPNLHLTLTLTRADGTQWDGATGRIDATLLTRVIPDLTEYSVLPVRPRGNADGDARSPAAVGSPGATTFARNRSVRDVLRQHPRALPRQTAQNSR